MAIPQITFIYDRYSKASAKRKASIEMRITYLRKQRYISTGIQIYPKQWKKGRVVNAPDADELNDIMDTMLKEVQQILVQMVQEGNIEIASIKDKLRRKKENRISFMDFCMQRAEVRKYRKSKDSQTRYDRFLRLFKEWGKIKEFDDITEASIISYDKYLDGKNMKANSKWYNYHRFLNSFIIDAINEGLLQRNPYKWINIDKGKSTEGLKRYLTLEEFNKIKKAKMPSESLERVKDVFIFQTYTCLSYTDLSNFNYDQIQEVKKIKVYTGKRNKTGKPFTIPLLPTALSILVKYEYHLPIISNVKYNEYLKVVAQAAGIDKKISSHWARHTGATLLLNEGVDMRIISKICGHSSIKMTEQIYAKLLDETVVDAIKDIEI